MRRAWASPTTCGSGSSATPARSARRSARLVAGGADAHQVHRHRRGADARHAARRRRAVGADGPRPRSRRRHAHGLFVAAHAHGTEGIKVAIRAGVRSIEHGSLIDDEGIAMLVANGTYLVADVYDGDWIAEEGRRAGWPAETMAKNEPTTQAQREGFTQGGRGGGPARVRHRQRGLPARDGRDPARLPGPAGPDTARGDPVGDDRRGRADGLGGPGRVARGRPVRGSRRRRARSAARTSRSCAGPATVVKGGVPVD